MLPPEIQKRIQTKIDDIGLRLEQFPHYRMTNSDRYRCRVGDYRIIYRFDGQAGRIHLPAVGHRREIYR